jgi:membrane fusion protein (multidrug efflux system)
MQRVPDMTEHSETPGSITPQPTSDVDASAAQDARPAQPPPEPQPVPQQPRKPTRTRTLVAGVLGVAVLAVVLVFGIPIVKEMLSTASTDDAYVNGHVTFVAPRVAGQISRVLVDDNNRVHKGDLLAELDKEPYQVAVSEKQAAVDTAKADLQAATATTRSRCCTRGSPKSTRARPRWRWRRSSSPGRGNWSGATTCRARCSTSGRRR